MDPPFLISGKELEFFEDYAIVFSNLRRLEADCVVVLEASFEHVSTSKTIDFRNTLC